MTSLNDLLDRGPLPGRMDLWLEDAHYFHGLHEQMIGEIASTLRQPLRDLSYVIGRETSLQVASKLVPDAYIRTRETRGELIQIDYASAAAELLAEPGLLQDEGRRLTGITVYGRDPLRLVTLIEVVSPGNKSNDDDIIKYIARRESLIFGQHVNVVEIDITRSYKRLTRQSNDSTPYHAAIYVVGHGLRIVPMVLKETFKRIAIPLAGEAIALDIGTIYQKAYEAIGLSDLMFTEGFYTPANLPFPSLLTDAEREGALAAVAAWQDEIRRAQGESA